MSFQISGLPLAPFAPLFGLSDVELASHSAVRQTADKFPGFPCRVSLRDAEPGETLLLLNYEHLPVATPYRSRHAIYIREGARETRLAVNEVPDLLRRRLLSLRAFSGQGMMLDADVTEGREIEPVIERMLDNPQAEYIHIHNARPGCYAARVDRVLR
jgi:hypothetical protein